MENGWTKRIEELEAEKDKLRDDLSKDKAILQNLLYREREEKRALEDAMTDLQAERDAAVRWLEEYKSKTYCAYCGATFNIDSDAAHVTEHIRTCPHHPMRELEAENTRLRMLRDAAESRAQGLEVERDADRRREYGYSQETVDALTVERDKLEEENQRLREALERIAAYDSYHSEWPTEIWINAPPEELAHVILSGGKYPPQQTHVGGKL